MNTPTKFSITDLRSSRIGKRIAAVALVAPFLLLLMLEQPVSAQHSGARKIAARTKIKRWKTARIGLKTNVQKKTVAKSGETANKPPNDSPSANAVAVVNAPETDYLSGEASVTVNPKQPTIVRLGLSQNAVSIVEFPASDGIYYIHEGNPNLVAVFQSPTRENDHFITLNPSPAFIRSNDAKKSPSVTVTLQMRSGLVLILEIVPAGDIAKNAHRCVVSYNREEVVAARRAAGLAVNLGDEQNSDNKKQTTQAVSRLIAEPTETQVASEKPREAKATFVRTAYAEVANGNLAREPNENRKQKVKPASEVSRFANKKLAEAIRNHNRTFAAWSENTYGLRVAVSRATDIDERQRLIVVAVRNETAENLRLVEGFPELQIQTVDDKGKALQIERLEKSYVETTSLNDSVTGGGTVYYAIVYRAPIVGASQRLRVLVSHSEAADEPATAPLPAAAALTENQK